MCLLRCVHLDERAACIIRQRKGGGRGLLPPERPPPLHTREQPVCCCPQHYFRAHARGLLDQRRGWPSQAAAEGPRRRCRHCLTQVRELGAGAYSRVVLALDRLTGQYLALKLVRRGPQSITKYVEREVGTACCRSSCAGRGTKQLPAARSACRL